MAWSVSVIKNKDVLPNGEPSKRLQTWLAVEKDLGIKIPIFVLLPKDMGKCEKVIFSIHGTMRNAKSYRKIFVESLIHENILLLAPLFDDLKFKSALALTLGNLSDGLIRNGVTPNVPEEIRTFTAIDKIFLSLREKYNGLKSYSIFGHSAGAQFAHRFAIFAKSSFLNTVVAANAGWYTLLDESIEYPYGVKDLFNKSDLKKILSRRVIIIAGENDTMQDRHLRLTEKTLLQGKNRFERAQYAVKKTDCLAKDLGVTNNWRLVIVPELKHNANSAKAYALEYLI